MTVQDAGSAPAAAARPGTLKAAKSTKAWYEHNLLIVPLSVVVGTAVWWAASVTLLPYLPTPPAIAEEFGAALGSPDFALAMATTLRRVFTGWLIGLSLALLIGLIMARSAVVDTLVHPVIFVLLALPGPVSILFSTLWLGLGELPALVALTIAVTPFMTTFVYDNAKALDPKLAQMAQVYRFSARQRLGHIVLPQLAPALLTSARIGFAMSWKFVVLVEVLAAGDGIGERVEYFFAWNEAAAVIAWTLSFTVVMVLLELLVFRALSRRLFRWRDGTDAPR